MNLHPVHPEALVGLLVAVAAVEAAVEVLVLLAEQVAQEEAALGQLAVTALLEREERLVLTAVLAVEAVAALQALAQLPAQAALADLASSSCFTTDRSFYELRLHQRRRDRSQPNRWRDEQRRSGADPK
jgi:hypothetical protein